MSKEQQPNGGNIIIRDAFPSNGKPDLVERALVVIINKPKLSRSDFTDEEIKEIERALNFENN